MTLVHCENITKIYNNSFAALDQVTLAIEDGEFISIMGPSGCGKSTLLNILGLLDTPTGGRYRLEGQNASDFKDSRRTLWRRKKIGFVFQSFNLLPRISALENIMLPMTYNGLLRKSAAQKARFLMKLVRLEGKEANNPLQLSGGEKQRVGIARSLANDPALILADEPTGNLDSKSGAEILELFLDLNRQGKTIVLVTHDHNIAAKTKRIIKLKDGRIVE
ncbi:MAG: ABC transporter ATP-binding protein [Elusimicrobia bacterium]|nr:ABC transporter ATP-binding protein [Elusimicrobiota bacterium]